MNSVIRGLRGVVATLAAAVLASCGGDGGSTVNEGLLAQTCSPNNPYRGDATAATKTGDIGTEKMWLRDHFDRNYLWYNEVPNVDPNSAAFSDDTPTGFYTSIDNYFNALLTPAITASGKYKDQFSFTYPTAAWDALINSGSTVGYGIEWQVLEPAGAPRSIRVAFVHTGSQAATRGIVRGDTLVSADGVSAQDTTPAGVAVLNAMLAPVDGSVHTLVFARAGAPVNTTYTVTAGPVALTPVQQQVVDVGGGQRVGYLLFNDHVLPAEQQLIDAVATLKSANPPISDLVLDLRYNGGGYLYIASQLAYMIAGGSSRPTLTRQVFEAMVFSDKRSAENSITTFFDVSCLPDPVTFQCRPAAPLPTLNLSRVYVLTSADTCSASEAIINSLRGVNVDVRLVGGTTCGKPYGFFATDNCGITYFPIEFQGVNAKGFGDYADGFEPGGAGVAGVAGCPANDDLDHALGDPAEGQLAAALAYRGSGNSACLPVALANRQTPLAAGPAAAAARWHGIKPPTLTNRDARMPTR